MKNYQSDHEPIEDLFDKNEHPMDFSMEKVEIPLNESTTVRKRTLSSSENSSNVEELQPKKPQG